MAKTTKPYRALRLTRPYMSGADIAAIQGRLYGLKRDGVYGPETSAKVRDWQWRVGYPDNRCKGALGIDQQETLLGLRKRTAAMIARTAARKAKGVLDRYKVTKSLGDSVVAQARARIGLTEHPDVSNVVPALQALGRDLGVQRWIAAMGYPWCAYFAFLMALATGKSKTAKAALVDYSFNGLYTPTIVAEARAGRHGMRVVSAADVKPGDLALFNFPGGEWVDHVEIVEVPPTGGELVTIGGNTSPGEAGSQSNGGGVFRRRRSTSQVVAFVRIS